MGKVVAVKVPDALKERMNRLKDRVHGWLLSQMHLLLG